MTTIKINRVLHLLMMLMIALVFVFEIICLSESLVMPDDVHMMMMSSHALLLLISWMILAVGMHDNHDVSDNDLSSFLVP